MVLDEDTWLVSGQGIMEVHSMQPDVIFSTLQSIMMSDSYAMKCVMQQCTLHPEVGCATQQKTQFFGLFDIP